jgi:hypothetical protein
MKLEIDINEGDDFTFLRAIRELTAVVRKHAPDARVRAMAARFYRALEGVLGKANPQKSSL